MTKQEEEGKGEGAEIAGGDLERTEQTSADELEALVRSSVEDEVTATGDPEAIERAALADAAAAADEDDPPSSEGAPVSMRELELEPEAMSLRDVELAMAPGKAPPKLPERAPPAPVAARVRTPPRAPLRSRPHQEGAEAPEPPPPRPRLSSIPPPLPHRDRVDEEIFGLTGGLSAPLPPGDLSLLLASDEPLAGVAPLPPTAGLHEHPAPPRKKKPKAGAEPAPPTPEDDESDVVKARREEGAREGGRPSGSATSRPAPAGDEDSGTSASPSDIPAKRSKRPRKSAAASDPAPARTSSRATTDRPARAASAAPATTAEPPSRTLWWLGGAAAAAVVGWLAFGGGGSPTPAATTAPSAAPAERRGEPSEPSATDEPSEPTPTATVVEEPLAAAPSASASTTAPPVPGPLPTAATPSPPTGSPPASTSASGVVAPPIAAPPSTTATPPAKPSATPVASGPFDKSAASAALASAVGAASGCKQPGDPSGVARVTVTFAPSGRVTQANLQGPPFAGTATGSCIAKAFRSSSVPPFEGDPVTVSKTVNLP